MEGFEDVFAAWMLTMLKPGDPNLSEKFVMCNLGLGPPSTINLDSKINKNKNCPFKEH